MPFFRSSSARFASLFGILSAAHLAACDPPLPTGDAGTDAPMTCETRPLAEIRFVHEAIGVTPGAVRRTQIGLAIDYCTDVEVTLTASTPGLATFPETLTIPVGSSHALFEVTGVAAGNFTLTATATGPNGVRMDTMEVAVLAAGAVPSCTGSGSGMATPGGTVTSTIDDVSFSVPAGAATAGPFHVDPFPVSMACAADIVPDGYVALGPAISFTSTTVYRFSRELDVTVPIALALLPSQRHRGHVEVAYTGPGVTEPRLVAIADPTFSGTADRGTFGFSVPRLGTYQAVVVNTPATRVSRRFVYRGIMGFSMGGSGSGRIGMGNPETFDFVAPLGGPTDWSYMLEHIRSYHLGGFCTEAERMAGATGCEAASLARTPPSLELFQHPQHFESWWYEDGYGGQGGTFNRSDYIEIFRDLGSMFGNANHDHTADGVSEPDIVPPGVPDSVRMMSRDERCSAPATVLTNFFDDEYNPAGTHPVITFCDGAERRDVPGDLDGEEDVGNWDPAGSQFIPIEVAVAVDLNGNGVRDAGEPVIRNGRENFVDEGCDRTASVDEAGYDALTNPDPAGDDYDFQYNPGGTEHNYLWDACRGGGMAELFDDFGLDGVDGTCQLGEGPTCYDRGEGNGVFDRTRGGERMIASTPRAAVSGYESATGFVPPLDDATLGRLDFFADGGVRDLFNWVVMGNHSMGSFSARGLPVRFYNGHGALHADGREANEFGWESAPWEEIGRYAMVRYGSIDASLSQLERGDGGHVGTSDQLASRIYAAVALMSSRWPSGDHRAVPRCGGECAMRMDFTSPTTGRTGPVSLVLPPGYFDPANADQTYPVMYFLHGYGMGPNDLPGLGLLMANDMVNLQIPGDRRLQKMIFVFPDGQCQGDECLRGTFYTDAPDNVEGGAQMQQFLLDLAAYVDDNYRTRAPETVDIWE